MTQHLKDMALEAAAHGRDDLLEASERAHLDACAECRGHVAETRVLSNDASLALREALPPMEDLESLIAAALDAAPVAAVRPSTRALLVSAVTAAAATVTLGLLSGASSLPTASSVFATLRDAAAVVGAVDRVVTVAVPGGWSLVLLGGFLVLLAVAVPLRRLAARSAPVPTPGAGAVLGVFALLLSLSLSPWGGVAHALELEGEWPELEASVSLSVERAPVGEVARQAAEAAGLGYAATLPEEVSGREVTLHVRDASLRDVLEAVLGDAPVIARRTGAMLVLSPGASTPPSEVGWHLKSVAGRKRVGLELGGNAAAIVHEDANIDYAVDRIVMGGYTNAGQNCISVQRVLLHRPIYNDTVEKLVAKIRALPVGDPRDPAVEVGPMIDRGAAEDAYRKVQEAVAQGAEILVGGKCEGTLFEPTVVANTKPDMSVNREELFAPVIIIAAYDDFDEAIAIANNTDFGLQSGVFTQDMNRIMRAYEEVEVGGLQINDVSTFRVDHMPYGGVKGSGVGREGPRYAIEEMCETKLMVMNLAGGRP